MKQCCIEVLTWLTTEGDTTAGVGTEEGGNLYPLLLAGGALLTALDIASFLYDWDLKQKEIAENERYWADYKKNTGVTPLYPHRAGAYYDPLGTALEVNQGVVALYRKAKNNW